MRGGPNKKAQISVCAFLLSLIRFCAGPQPEGYEPVLRNLTPAL